MNRISLFALIGLIAVSTVFASCSEAVDVVPTEEIPFKVFFVNSQESTRTTGTNSGLITWTLGDRISIYHASSGNSLAQDAAFTVEDPSSGFATGMLKHPVEDGMPYNWLAVYPYNTADVSAFPLTLGSASMVQKGNNSRAHLSGSFVPVFGRTSTNGTDAPTFTMDQICSAVKISVRNGTDASMTVSEIVFTAPVNVVGSYIADFSGNGAPILAESSSLSKAVTLSVLDSDALSAGSSAEFYIPIAPITLSSGSIITITVKATNGTSQEFSKVLGSNLSFISGKINSTAVDYTATKEEVPGAEPAAYGACPTDAQVAWQRQELIMFYHFGPATFSGYDGDKADYSSSQLISQFTPSSVNAEQWVTVAAENGFKEVILTAKHHDGFSLWDNPESTCDVAACPSPYNVDIVKAVSVAAKSKGINFGIYMSPWDKVNGNDANYASKYISAIHSVADGAYGPITEFWLDGHNASSLNFNSVNAAILEKNPNCVIFSNVGPGCRWVGNEDGVAGATNWSKFSPSRYGASQTSLPGSYSSYLSQGDQDGSYWIPAECDLSIRPIGDNNGWFWGARSETPKTARELLSVYYNSVGRNSVMLLNVPPTTAGILDPADVAVLETFHGYLTNIFGTNLLSRSTVDEVNTTEARGYNFKAEYVLDGDENTYWAVGGDNTTSATLVLDLDGTKTFNVVSLQEFIKKGQRVERFSIQYYDGSSWKNFSSGTTIGAKCLIKGSTVNASKIRVKFNSLACPLISEIGLYMDDVR